MECKFCGASGFKQHKNHERQCKLNPNRTSASGHKGGNQFTTGKAQSHSDETKRLISEKSSKHKHSDKTKQKLSEIRKQFLLEHPEKVPYLLNHSSSSSYPEKYFQECFSDASNITEQYKVSRYKLDFANVAEKIYFEVDGEQHYVDPRIVEHDCRRTKVLTDLGWTGIRIRWAEFQRMPQIEKEVKIKEIRRMMKLVS